MTAYTASSNALLHLLTDPELRKFRNGGSPEREHRRIIALPIRYTHIYCLLSVCLTNLDRSVILLIG
jgi:hypothetical protein